MWKTAVVLSLVLVGCDEPPPLTAEDRARQACALIGHQPGQAGFTDCFARVLPAYVQADAQRSSARRAAAAAYLAGAPPVVAQAPRVAVQQPRRPVHCYHYGAMTTCQ